MYNYYNPYNPYDYYTMNPENTTSYVRLFHASPDAPPVDIYVNNNLVAPGLAYRQFTEYLPLSPGRYNVQVFPAGTRRTPVINTDLNVEPEMIYTVAAIGKLENIKLRPIKEPRMPIPQGKLYVRFGHFSPNAPKVDVKLADGTPLFQNVGFEEVTKYIPINPGTYTLNVFIAGTNERVLYLPNITFKADRFYSVYAIGLAGGNPPLQVVIPLDGNSYL